MPEKPGLWRKKKNVVISAVSFLVYSKKKIILKSHLRTNNLKQILF